MSFDHFNYQKSERVMPGNYRLMLMNAAEGTTSTGKKKLVLEFRISGTRINIRDSIVDSDWFDRFFSRFLDAFPGILEGNANPAMCEMWRGYLGAATLGLDENGYLIIKKYLPPYACDSLPEFEWVPKDGEPLTQPVPTGFVPAPQTVRSFSPDDDLPFDL